MIAQGDVSVFVETCTCEEMSHATLLQSSYPPCPFQISLPHQTTTLLAVHVPVFLWPHRTAVFPVLRHPADVRVHDSISTARQILSSRSFPWAMAKSGWLQLIQLLLSCTFHIFHLQKIRTSCLSHRVAGVNERWRAR